MPVVPKRDNFSMLPSHTSGAGFDNPLSGDAAGLPGRQISDVGEAIESSAPGVAEAADAWARSARDKAEATVALDGSNALQTLKLGLSDPNTGYRSVQGADAVKGLGGGSLTDHYLSMFDQGWKDVAEKMTPGPRVLFDQSAAVIRDDLAQGLLQHEAEQGRVWRSQVLNQTVSNAAGALMAGAGGDGYASQARAALTADGMAQGLSGENLDKQTALAFGRRVVEPVVTARLSQGDVAGARAFFDTHRNGIAADDAQVLDGRIGEASTAANARAAVDDLCTLHGPKALNDPIDIEAIDAGLIEHYGNDTKGLQTARDEALHRIARHVEARDETHAAHINTIIARVKGGASPAELGTLPQFLALPEDRQREITDWQRDRLVEKLTGFAPDQNLEQMSRQFAAYHDLSAGGVLKQISEVRIQALEPVLGEALTRQAVAKTQTPSAFDATDFATVIRSIGLDPDPAPSDISGKAQLGVLRSAADAAIASAGKSLTPQQQRDIALDAAQVSIVGHPLFQLSPGVRHLDEAAVAAQSGKGRSASRTPKSDTHPIGVEPHEHVRGSQEQRNQQKVRQLLQGTFRILSEDNVVTRDGRVWELAPGDRNPEHEGLPNREKLTSSRTMQIDRLPELLKDGVRNGQVYYIPRTAWARPPEVEHLDRQTRPYTVITLHHTGNEQTPWQTEDLHRGGQALQRGIYNKLPKALQIFGKGQVYNDPDVGYHFFISRNGDIYEGRGLQYNGEHVGGHNSGNIGVAFLGNYTTEPLTDQQVRSSRLLVQSLEKIYDIRSVKTHGDWDSVKQNELRGAWPQLQGILKNR